MANKPPMALAKTYDGECPSAYAVSEKLDGVRAWWDGAEFTTRAGKPIHAPAWFKAPMPQGEVIDGELWKGRGRFEATCSAVKKKIPVDAEWEGVRFMAFDLPMAGGVFSERLDRLNSLPESAHFAAVPAVEADDLQAALDAVVAAGGEGLMLHHLDAEHSEGRTADLLKLKPKHDAEGVVVAHEWRVKEAVMVVEIAAGTFSLRCPPCEDLPPVGATITYSYEGLTRNGIPRFAAFMRVREAA